MNSDLKSKASVLAIESIEKTFNNYARLELF